MIRPCPLCGQLFSGTATEPAVCSVCVQIARWLKGSGKSRADGAGWGGGT